MLFSLDYLDLDQFSMSRDIADEHYRIRGLAWMKKQEEGYTKGGILADDMGLGKTVQAIALMLARPAPENDRRPNLIVAPVALMLQWKRVSAELGQAPFLCSSPCVMLQLTVV